MKTFGGLFRRMLQNILETIGFLSKSGCEFATSGKYTFTIENAFQEIKNAVAHTL